MRPEGARGRHPSRAESAFAVSGGRQHPAYQIGPTTASHLRRAGPSVPATVQIAMDTGISLGRLEGRTDHFLTPKTHQIVRQVPPDGAGYSLAGS
jgi:hypothetical protein